MDFRGAPASNAGDDYHELWVTRQAIRLLDSESDLTEIAVEGVSQSDASGAPSSTWSGVDCTLYFGGTTPSNATRVEIVQVKYSTTHPQQAWTVSRLVRGGKGKSVLARLARAWKAIAEKRRPTDTHIVVTLVSNQPAQSALVEALQRLATTNAPPASDTPEERLAHAVGLGTQELQALASSLHLKCGADSRLALEEEVLRSVGHWTDFNLRHVASDLQDFVRRKMMMPDEKGRLINRTSVLAHLGVSDELALFPCPADIEVIATPVSRTAVRKAALKLQEQRYVCLHGQAGVGKTTALQEIEASLPDGSIMLKYDCYGAGRYLDSSALRHRTKDAFLQLTNELSARLRLPLFLLPSSDADYPRHFMKRLRQAAALLSADSPERLLVVAVDAADNAVVAGQHQQPHERSFVHDFVRLAELPCNVRFVLTARTGRLQCLELPPNYLKMEVEPFEQEETRKYVVRQWPSAPRSWVEDFHRYSNGIPRVQDAAFAAAREPRDALQRLLPAGKSLEIIFEERFHEAIQKAGAASTLTRFCAALISLPRPVPISTLANILDEPQSHVLDVCQDLAPSIRHQEGNVSFADEDLEEFVRTVGADNLPDTRERIARFMLDTKDEDSYAALNVANALISANLRTELLHLVETQPSPPDRVLSDPILRREAELQRLRLAIVVCREAANVPRALRFVLVGAESTRSEAALRELLTDNPDLAVRFAEETVRRLVMSDPRSIESQGAFLFHGLAVDATSGAASSERARRRKIAAWLEARESYRDDQKPLHRRWAIEIDAISAAVEATLKLRGPLPAIQELQGWYPRSVKVDIGLRLPWRLIVEGHVAELETLARELSAAGATFLLVPLGLSGRSIDIGRLARGVEVLAKRIDYRRLTDSFSQEPTTMEEVVRLTLTAIEVLVVRGGSIGFVDGVLATMVKELSGIEVHSEYQVSKLDILLRAYTLREAIHGRKPEIQGVFTPRQKAKRHDGWSARDHRVQEVAKAALGLYAAVASSIVGGAQDVDWDLRSVDVATNQWTFNYYGSAALTGYMGAHMSLLLLLRYEPSSVWQWALKVHGDWRDGWVAPSDVFLERFSLWPSLHGCLIGDVAAAAGKTRTDRRAALEKVELLVRHSRSLVAISPRDAGAIFNMAVDVVGEIDVEFMDTIELIDGLVEYCRHDAFPAPRQTAARFANILADAAVRLDGYRHFPWMAAMACLARLDLPCALASVARWHDEDVARIWSTLPSVLRVGAETKAMRAQQAVALALFLDGDPGIYQGVLQSASPQSLRALSEEIAYDVLIRRVGNPNDVFQCVKIPSAGRWATALSRQQEFLDALPPERVEARASETHEVSEPAPLERMWALEELVDVERLNGVIQEVLGPSTDWPRLRVRDVLVSARSAVPPAKRVSHVSALAKLECHAAMTGEVAGAILEALAAWRDSPAVTTWAHAELAEVIVARFGDFAGYLQYHDSLSEALTFTNASAEKCNEIILRGLEATAGSLSPVVVLNLVEMVARNIDQGDAAELIDWYVGRLEQRVPEGYRNQLNGLEQLPATVDDAVARFLFSHLGDCDLRLRWRAAHAIRRLARTNDVATIGALIDQFSRREDAVFRAPNCAFYWLAARLWFTIAFDRMAGECPEIAVRGADQLLSAALDDSLPHVLIRSFARDACEKLRVEGLLPVTGEQQRALEVVNESVLPRNGRLSSGWPRPWFGQLTKGRRFQFNWMDTLPYWYQPMLRVFSNVEPGNFLTLVERWIVDEWHFEGDLRKLEEDRQGRFGSQGAMTDNRQGTRPTIEILERHLEWHAMWCAVGELLKVEPLSDHSDDSLREEVAWSKLASPPIWSADLASPTPFEGKFWRTDVGPLGSWIKEIDESVHLSAMFSEDPLDYVVVDGGWSRHMSDRVEIVNVRSALVAPSTASSLVRAWQATGDSWVYVVPFEDEVIGRGVDEPPFQLLGWLHNVSLDHSCGVDGKDPFRAHGMGVQSSPGERVTKACGLVNQIERGRCWWSGQFDPPMFVYQAWGEDDEEGASIATFSSSGCRLLAQKAQLRRFLSEAGWKLIVEVRVTRRDRKHRRRTFEEGEEDGRYTDTNVYLFEEEGHSRAREVVVALGQAIVEDLDFPQGSGALERWMAHHLAGVLRQLSEASDDGRTALKEEALELIVRLWRKRWSLVLSGGQESDVRRPQDLDEGVPSERREESEVLQQVRKSLFVLLARLRDASTTKPTAR